MENIILYSSKVLLSEDESNPDVYIAKFIICDFGKNKNGVMLNRDTINEWVSTLKNKPLVGKIKLRSDGVLDFSGHNVVQIEKIDENGNKYIDISFDTDAFGTFTDVTVEEIDGMEYIVATAEIWKRFERACEIIKSRAEEGSLKTSWEISVVDGIKKVINGSLVKVINKGRFIGHCLLSKYTEPAYNSSGLLEIASYNEDVEISDALSQDFLESSNKEVSQNLKKEDETKLAKENKVVASEEVVTETVAENQTPQETSTEAEEIKATEETPVETQDETQEIENEEVNNTETSALTDWDLKDKIREACKNKINKWCWVAFHFPTESEVWVSVDDRESELDYLLFTYSVENDVVAVSEPTEVKLTVSVKEVNTTIATLQAESESKNLALAEASKEIQLLKTTIANLEPYKAQVEKAEQEKIEAKLEADKETLRSTALATGLISKEELEKSEEIKGLIDSLNEKELNQIIATRLIASLQKKEVKVETSSTKEEVATASLVTDEIEVDTQLFRKTFLGGRK